MKYVLVTGAYGGMGKATIKLLKEKGYFIFALDKKVEEKEDNILPIECDITSEKSILLAFEKIKKVTNQLFAIIHYAGIYMLNSLVEIEHDKFEKIFKINLFGAFLINKTFLPLLKDGSKIIMTTSELASLDPLPFTGLYAITKSALDKYAYSLRMELQLLNISVSTLRAGAVNTGMLNVSMSELDDFCNNTKLYNYNAKRFMNIVNSVEAKKVLPIKVAKKTYKILNKKNPKFAYSINRNKLLILLNILPKRLQFWIIRKILK